MSLPPPPPSPTPQPPASPPAPPPIVDNTATFPADRPRRRPFSLGEIIAWLVILLAVGAIFTSSLINKRRDAEPAATGKISPPDIQFLAAARYIVGLHALVSTKIAAPSPPVSELTQTLNSAAKTPADHFRALIVKAELQDPASIQHDLGRFAAANPGLAGDVQTLRSLWAGTLSTTAPQWQAFRKRHGWFADLAAGEGRAASDPLRVTAVHAAIRTLVTIVIGSAGALVLLLAGLGLLIWIAILFFTRRLASAFNRARPLPPSRRAYVEAFALFIGFFTLAGFGVRFILWLSPSLFSGVWGFLALPIAYALGIFWPLVRGQSWSQLRSTLGLHAGKGIFREILAGLAGYLAGLPLLALAFLLTAFLTKISGLDATHPIVEELTGPPLLTALILFLACIFAPITEELMFRGALFAHLRERLGFFTSAVAVSILFAAIHPQGWPAIPVLATLAFTFASLREVRGSIIPCMAGHALNNSIVMVFVLLMMY